MPKGLKIFLFILIFALVSTLGFFSFGLVSHNNHLSCPIAALSGNGCPESGGSLAMTIHHLSGLLQIMQATINSLYNADIILQFLFFLLWFVLASCSMAFLFQKLSLLPTKVYVKIFNTLIKPKDKLIIWLALCCKLNPADKTCLGA